jgi:hypothetical protein
MNNIFKRADGLKVDDERMGPLLGEALGSLPESGECPTPEDLAALSENKIGGNERERLFLHLAGCGRCRTAYSMVCEIASGAESAASADYRWQARRLVPLAAAAGLILVIVSWPLLDYRESPVEVIPRPEARTPAKEKMETAPISTAPAVPLPAKQAVRPTVPMPEQPPANDYASADGAAITTGSPGMTASPVIEAPMPAGQAKTELAPPARDDSSLALSRKEPTALGETKMSPGIEPRFVASPITKSAESPPEPVNLHRRVEIDKGQRLSLSKADAATYDKVKIEEIFNDLKLDMWGFPLQDINKVVIQWTGSPRRRGQLGVTESGEGAAGIQPREREKVQAIISLEDGGVLTIDIQGNPLLRKNRGAKIPVGC